MARTAEVSNEISIARRGVQVAFEHQAEARRKQDVAVLGAFAAIDKNLAGTEVDIADLDVDELAHAHRRIEEQLEQDLVLHVLIQFWDDILRFIATIKLKETTASDIFRRLNSYSKQHGLYHALKAFGQILKSIFILRVIDEPVLRMSIEKVLSAIEHVHAFTRAVSIGNPREFLQAEKEDQEMAEASKRLIKNCIICWNYLYLSQKLAEIDDPAKRKELLQGMAHGSAAAWGHLNLLGEYDFSRTSFRIRSESSPQN